MGCVRAAGKTNASVIIKRSLTAADCGRHLFATDTHHWCSRLCTPRAENWLRSPVRVLVSPALPPLLEAQLAALPHRRMLRIPVMIPITDDRLQVFRWATGRCGAEQRPAQALSSLDTVVLSSHRTRAQRPSAPCSAKVAEFSSKTWSRPACLLHIFNRKLSNIGELTGVPVRPCEATDRSPCAAEHQGTSWRSAAAAAAAATPTRSRPHSAPS